MHDVDESESYRVQVLLDLVAREGARDAAELRHANERGAPLLIGVILCQAKDIDSINLEQLWEPKVNNAF